MPAALAKRGRDSADARRQRAEKREISRRRDAWIYGLFVSTGPEQNFVVHWMGEIFWFASKKDI